MERYGIIMAGGSGTRFWPLSRKSLPKQFLNLTGKDSMVNETIDRLATVIEKDHVFVVTNAAHADLTFRMTNGRLKRDHILAEPAARNTAACIGYAAMEIVKKYGDGIMGIFASDHYIKDESGFREVLERAVRTAEEGDKLVTIGIKPYFPSTGYGYIKRKSSGLLTEGTGAAEVEEFVEKPDLETAKRYLESGDYLWNSGMFIWKASVILKQFEKLLPDIYDCLLTIGESMGTEREREAIDEIYPKIPKISIDYGIMERAENVFVLEGDFGWNDVGSLDAMETLHEPDENGNVVCGENISLDVKDCVSYGESKLIAMIGVENLIVVETNDTVLVCDKSRAQDVKKIVERLETEGKDKYL
ncbi:MAG: mannose-1-phosphate guanylyltransferase [Lachnospiraceae bacterium]|nr:mannose-1-phosphate guanylyltransferase [Lachnospiraceae bacterium]